MFAPGDRLEIDHFLMKCVYTEYVYVNQTLMEEAIYIHVPVHVHVPVLHLDFGRNEKERRRRTKAIDGGVGGRSMVILNLSYAGKRLAARMSDTNLTVNRLIIALLNFHIPPPSLEEEMEESITGRTDVARGDHPEFGSQKMQKTQAKDAMMTYLPAHCIAHSAISHAPPVRRLLWPRVLLPQAASSLRSISVAAL